MPLSASTAEDGRAVMTEQHEVNIQAIPLGFEISCSCGEILKAAPSMPVDEASNLRWQHLVKYMTPMLFEDVVVHGSCDSPECKWCHIQPPSYYLREI